MSALIFPTSKYLRERWWHRLAIVVLWAWLAISALFALRWIVFDPYSACVRIKYALSEPSNLDCGSGPFSYLVHALSQESDVWASVIFLLVALMIVLFAPGLLYRIFLYVAKGSSWKDHGPAA